MADYVPLISRAVAGLESNTGENRRVLYDRARNALVNQLRGVDPPLNESDITRERLALEDAIRKVESDAAKWRPEGGGEAPRQFADSGLRGFRDTMAEADGLGAAAAHARRAAHDVFESVPGGYPPAQPGEGQYFDPQGGDPHYAEPHEGHDADAGEDAGRHPPQPRFGAEPYARPARSYGRIVKIALLLLVVGALAGGLYSQRATILKFAASWRSSAPSSSPTAKRDAAPLAGQQKIPDRVGQNNNQSATAPAAAVAQKVVLYDEDTNNPQGHRFVGSALWRTETVSPGPGLAPELAVRADVEIPERHMRMTWSMRRNSDKALPASHTIEIMFTLPADFAEGGIGNVPGVLMKSNEEARGVPLAGLTVKVTNGYFLIGLSAVDVDVQRNVQLMKDQDWLDIPVVYTTGKRGILAMEKGTPGARAFEEAFRAWGE